MENDLELIAKLQVEKQRLREKIKESWKLLGHKEGSSVCANKKQQHNVFIGAQAGGAISTGNSSVTIGQQAGLNVSSGSYNYKTGGQVGQSALAYGNVASTSSYGDCKDQNLKVADWCPRCLELAELQKEVSKLIERKKRISLKITFACKRVIKQEDKDGA